MVHAVLVAATRTAEILYPANSHSLLLEVDSRLITATNHQNVLENTIMIKKKKARSVLSKVVLLKQS